MKRTLCFLMLSLAAVSLDAAEPSAELIQRIMKAADKDQDGKLTLEEYKPLDVQARHHGKEHFQAGDANQDGLIDAAEPVGTLRKQTWFAIISEGSESCFTRLDANGDGKLDSQEYRKISRMGHHSDQHFKGADTSKDGLLDLAEFTDHGEQRLKKVEGESNSRSAESGNLRSDNLACLSVELT
ncbi:MAG: EF-hand domain-containing protein [Planctomycetaceae bacterium]